VRGKPSTVLLLALAVATLAPSLGTAQYAPKWHVGDWWVVKTWHEDPSGDWVWDLTRYDIVRTEKVGQHDYFVLESHYQEPSGLLSQAKEVYSIRKDNWLVVRQVMFYTYRDSFQSATLDRPLGQLGPFLAGEPRLPRFPLQLASTDTTFRLQIRDDCAADLREISQIADPTTVARLLGEGDAAGELVMRPSGEVYQIRNECGGNRLPGPPPGKREIVQSFQFWCGERPWRLYEEFVYYHGSDLVRDVTERSWLVAVGHGKK
jgi:hypothetical protein